jgi:polynucleotide 5'-hydroxyl-kinase GRC3/NOL9
LSQVTQVQAEMSRDWADKISQHLLNRGLMQAGICLILGGVDTGKTTLTAALAKHMAQSQHVGIVDADIGQSHIGPPTTVGWALLDNPQVDFSKLTTSGISFVGDVTPERHLLQLAAGIVQCVQQVSKITKSIIIDTPGFIRGPAAAALWWTVQRILRPDLVLAVQRYDELGDILAGWASGQWQIEHIKAPEIPTKSWETRQRYRQRQFAKYFRNSSPYKIDLTDIAVQTSSKLNADRLVGRLVGLRNEKGIDSAIGIIDDWQDDKGVAVVRAPQLGPPGAAQVRCLVIGDASVEIGDL